MENQETATPVETVEINEAKVSVYDQAAALYKEGKAEEAVALIRKELGDEEAEKAAGVMKAADEIKAADTPEVVS